MDDRVVSKLFTLTNLIELSLSIEYTTSVTPAALHFSALRHLKMLSFNYVVVYASPGLFGDSHVARIAEAPSLTALSLRIPLLGSSALASLTQLTSLAALDISWSPRLTTLAPLTALTTLERLALCGSTDNVPQQDIRDVAALPRLFALRLTPADELLDLYDEIRKAHPRLQVTLT